MIAGGLRHGGRDADRHVDGPTNAGRCDRRRERVDYGEPEGGAKEH
jgi:hypothetical protein